MSNKNTFKRLIGVGAFACCSAILLSVTAQSARSQQIPSVSDLGGMIGGTFRFYQTLNEENGEAAADAVIPETMALDRMSADKTSADKTSAEKTTAEKTTAEAPSSEEAEPEDAARSLPDFTEDGDADFIPLTAAPELSAADPEPVDAVADDNRTAAEPSAPAASGAENDWMDSGSESAEPAAGKDDKDDGEENKAPASGTLTETGTADARKTDADKTDAEPVEEAADGKDGDWMETVETENGGEELTAAASVTLTLSVDNNNHTEYLHGYEDGTARPGGKITRAEACQILYNLLKSRPKERAALSDVKDDAWYAEPVRLLAACGIVDCPGDKARPDDYMTRAELVSALTRLVQAGSAGKVSFTDVPVSHTYYNAIAKAVGLGWVNGYEDGTFKPDGSITRAEAAKVVNRALNRNPDKDWIDANITESLYSDLTPDHWAYYELMEASVAHTASVSGSVEKWNPGTSGTEKPAEEKSVEEKPAETEKPADAEKPADEKPAETAEGEKESAKPETTGWMDEELERMLAEPLPEEVDESRLEFDGLELYALDEDGKRMADVTLGRFLTFGKDGKYTSGDEKLDKYVKDLLAEITTEDMSREEKLKAAYEYCRDHFMYRRNHYYEVGETGWEVEEALTMFSKKKGNCYNFASSFAMLARQLGYDAEAISGLVGNELQPHGWVEIVRDGKRLFYDTILESSYLERGYDFDFFGSEYEKAPWPYHKH